MGKNIFADWSPREKCIKKGKMKLKKPKGLEYQGMSEYGTFYYQKRTGKTFIQARRCKDGKTVYVD